MDKNEEYKKLYDDFKRTNRIKIAGYTQIEDSYYFHIKVPSETHKEEKYEYDVVIRFFTTDPTLLSSSSLRGYYIQFFSNSPGFIYKYAYVYNKNGYMIDALYNKLDQNHINQAPDTTNKEQKLSYDKTIFFACQYLADSKFRVLNKTGLITQKKKTPQKFFADISDFTSVKIDQELMNSEKSLKQEIRHNRSNQSVKRTNSDHVKSGSHSTSSKTSISYVKKKTGTKIGSAKKISGKKKK